MNIPNQRHISLVDGAGSDFFCLRLLCTKEPQVAVKIQMRIDYNSCEINTLSNECREKATQNKNSTWKRKNNKRVA